MTAMDIPDLLRRGAGSAPGHAGPAAGPIARLLRMAAWDAELCNRINANAQAAGKPEAAHVAYHPMVTEAVKVACMYLGEPVDQVLMLLPEVAQDGGNAFAWDEPETP